MVVFHTEAGLQAYVKGKRILGKTVGFSPTMGALHEGHMSLIEKSRATCDISVCSIFVNPTQFNESSDLDKYPRTVEKDLKMLEAAGCDAVILPSVKAVYPKGTRPTERFDLGFLTQPMEGAHRPGHFDGVVQVVKRLLEMVLPTHLFMGQKDFQQFSIIARLLQLINSEVKIVCCPIVREADGLAMSSRNVRLSAQDRKNALVLSSTLKQIKAQYPNGDLSALITAGMERMNAIEGVDVEYLEAAHQDTLRPVKRWADSSAIVLCTAARVGAVRLIDNVLIP